MVLRVEPFFDPATFTFSYVLSRSGCQQATVIDPVFDYDPVSGRVSSGSADTIVEYLEQESLTLQWILETHVHADHLSAARYLKRRVGGLIGIGDQVTRVQQTFADVFNAEPNFATDGSQFDRLLVDGDEIPMGSTPDAMSIRVLHTPGHTPACVSYQVGACVFVGDTLFMPDYGSARTDFPGGDAAALYASAMRLLSLDEATTMYLCHDYGTPERPQFCGETTVGEQLRANIHLHRGVSESEFVENRQSRDAGLAAPKLLYPAVQFNMRGGEFPPAETNGRHYFKIPISMPAE